MENEENSKKRELVLKLLQQKLLLGPETLNSYVDLEGVFINKVRAKRSFSVINEYTKMIIDKDMVVNCIDFERMSALNEKGRKGDFAAKFTDVFFEEKKLAEQSSITTKIESNMPPTEVVFSYNSDSQSRKIEDFVRYFNKRYNAIEKILRCRQELQSVMSISRVLSKKEKESVSIIGMVSEVHATKNGNLMITVEDPTGQIKAVVNKNKPELFELVKNIVLDEVIGIVGVCSENIIFVNNILWPDVPSTKELKKAPQESYAVFLSDIHVGSNYFLGNEFNKFLKWINCAVGSDQQKAIASKVKYVFIIGDLVDGVGVYPNQDKELEIKDIYQQYSVCAELLRRIPSHIQIIICPGNHDALRIAEPQPIFYKDFSEGLWTLPNVLMVSNPALVNIAKTDGFSGIDVLLYHGYSFDYYISNVDYLRNSGGYDRADLVMRFLMQRRHLAPTHASTLYVPDAELDPLVINKIPDIFATGHIHKSVVASYKNITLICGSCWQSKTAFQEKVGHHPEPARVPVVNLQTREAKIIRFA